MARLTRLAFPSLVLAACSGRAPVAPLPVGGEWSVLGATPDGSSPVALNQTISFVFSAAIDPATVTATAVGFRTEDAQGNLTPAAVRGTFRVLDLPDGSKNRVLAFEPALPVGAAPHTDQLRVVGLAPATTYVMEVAGLDSAAPSLLRDEHGRALRTRLALRFTTRAGTRVQDLFADPAPGGPRVVDIAATPQRAGELALGGLAGEPVEVRVRFDQALNPMGTNLVMWAHDELQRLSPRTIDRKARGRVFLEYDDPEFGPATWIPARLSIERNDAQGCILLLHPHGVLPNAADLRLIVEPELMDIAGESNAGNTGHARVAATLRTEAAPGPQFGAFVEDFKTLEHIDFAAPLLEPAAEVDAGYARAAGAFAGRAVTRDFRPRVPEVLLNTDLAEVTPEFGAPFQVAGGVFEFRNVTIPRGVVVRGVGTKPMMWLVTGDFVVEGELSVQGGHGRSGALRSFNNVVPSYGGSAGCAGGRGGTGSPSQTDTDIAGEDGFGPYQEPGGGGVGGRHNCTSTLVNCGRGGGGGGGSFLSAGDSHHPFAWLNALPGVASGMGGRMCFSNNGPRVAAGPLAFLDQRRDNDFYGAGVDVRRGLRIAGELLVPRGGAGGGGGGDSGVRCPPNAGFVADAKGGGGGGGGGALIIQALGRVVVASTGWISANGGHGGGGEQAGSNSHAGGGGGGSGGMVVVMAGAGIHIAAHGAPMADGVVSSNANGAYTFAIEADGGVGLRGPFFGNPVAGKYPGRGAPQSGAVFDGNPIGGFGGLGLIQFLTPPGSNLAIAAGGDGTNTRLDDAVHFYPDDARLAAGLASSNPNLAGAMVGESKRRYLGWRGLMDEGGVGRDDAGNEVRLPHNNHGEGDIRPAPVLLPVPYGAVSRVRSRWIDTGVTARRPASGSGGEVRALAERIDPLDPTNPFTSLRAGPTWLFAGTFHDAQQPTGYVAYRASGATLARVLPEVLPAPVPIATLTTEVWRGAPAHRVTLTGPSPILAHAPGRYTGYRAHLLGPLNEPRDMYRILAHDGVTLHLDGTAALPRDPAAKLQVVADFLGFDHDVAAPTGFGGLRAEHGRVVPRANVRVGFAFHVDPTRPRWSGGLDLHRVPQDPAVFLYTLDLQRPEVLRQVRDLGKTAASTEGATWLQYDLTFNTAFSGSAPYVQPGAPAHDAPRPTVRWLALPVQF